MKKIIIFTAITSFFYLSITADTVIAGPVAGTSDSSSAAIQWAANIPVIVPGEFITFTGDNSGPIKDGMLDIQANGKFSSTPVLLELRYYDDETGDIGTGVIVGEDVPGLGLVKANTITYRVSAVQLTSKQDNDLSGTQAQVLMNNVPVSSNVDLVETDADSWKTSWSIKNKPGSGIDDTVAGDTVTATTVIYADVNFAN
ncbi:hypothetical protein Sps_02882 [Shewanella psychrophila]|uniref:Uncharacterized protein n=1 Tax=Shewanella psychrophila TaxID=225848 RepID=A0A1S6HR79_9GAMM|nr:hypothetical protein [Shewanella psychrophila]AQS38030.1 hypothetical protein Sps_02882 [Shewanella psychrophila]